MYIISTTRKCTLKFIIKKLIFWYIVSMHYIVHTGEFWFIENI